MEVTTDIVRLRGDLLIANVSGDPIHIGEYGSDQDDWVPLEVGSSASIEGMSNGIGVVSDGVSQVGILPGGTGIFPPAVDGVGSNVYGQPQPIVTVSGTTHTISSVEAGSLIRCTSNSPITITVPKDVTDDIPDGVYYDVSQVGTGQITFVAESGATITPADGLGLISRGQRSRIGIQKVAANTFDIFGDLEAA